MRIRCNRVRHVLNLTKPAVGKLKSMWICENILFKENHAVANSLDFAIAATLPELEADEEFLIPHRVLQTTLAHVPGNSMLEFTRDGKNLTIKGESFTTNLQCPEVADFPDFPSFEETTNGDVDGDLFVRETSKLVIYAAKDATRPVLAGVCFDLGERVRAAATDSFRMAWVTFPFELKPRDENQSHQAVVPTKTLRALEVVWKRVEKRPPQNSDSVGQLVTNPQLEVAAMVVQRRYMNVRIGDGWIAFGMGEATLVGQTVSGAYPNYTQLIPASPTHQVVFDAATVYRAMRQVRPMAPASELIKLSWRRDALTVAVEHEEMSGEVEVRAATTGRASHFSLKASYLLDYLKDKEGRVLMECTNPSTAATFTHSNSPNVLIMPMFAKATKAVEEAEAADETAGETAEEEEAEE